jgi:hypothetical protein
MPLLPLRRLPSLAKPGQSLLSRFLPRPYAPVPRRFFYGHITDTKMAPSLEPFFKQYVKASARRAQRKRLTGVYLQGRQLVGGLHRSYVLS